MDGFDDSSSHLCIEEEHFMIEAVKVRRRSPRHDDSWFSPATAVIGDPFTIAGELINFYAATELHVPTGVAIRRFQETARIKGGNYSLRSDIADIMKAAKKGLGFDPCISAMVENAVGAIIMNVVC
jgi:hypothetical protein